MNGTENTSEYYLGYEEGDDFPATRGGKYNGVYFFRDEAGDLIYTGTDGNEWYNFKQDWKNQQNYQLEEAVEEVVDEQPLEVVEVVEVVDEQPAEVVEENFEDTTIYTSSNGGTPIENPNIPALTQDGSDLDKLDFSSRYASPNGGNDRISGTRGANTFEVNLLLNATPEVIEPRIDRDGRVNWRQVANANDNYHDHWVDSIGEDTIVGFSGSGGEGDKIDISGHTVAVTVLEESENQVKLGIYSDQSQDGYRSGGAHDFDVLGTLTIEHDGNFNYGRDVSVNPGVFDGVFEFA